MDIDNRYPNEGSLQRLIVEALEHAEQQAVERERDRHESEQASIADYINTRLRENYGDRSQLKTWTDDLRPAIDALVTGARHSGYYASKREIKALKEAAMNEPPTRIQVWVEDEAKDGSIYGRWHSRSGGYGDIEYISLKEHETVLAAALEEAVRPALNELGVPVPGYPQPVANAVEILNRALQHNESSNRSSE